MLLIANIANMIRWTVAYRERVQSKLTELTAEYTWVQRECLWSVVYTVMLFKKKLVFIPPAGFDDDSTGTWEATND